MDKELADKIGRVERALREQSVDELARFDVKDGEEDYIPYYKTYVMNTIGKRSRRMSREKHTARRAISQEGSYAQYGDL